MKQCAETAIFCDNSHRYGGFFMNHLEKVKILRADTSRHYNCCQALLAAFSDITGMDEEQAYALGNDFGAGMNHGATCGTITAAFMILGMKGYDKKVAADLLIQFRNEHGFTDCAHLLKAAQEKGIVRKVHCDGLVFEICSTLDHILQHA